MKPLRIGIVGCGAIATRKHIPAFKKLGNVVLRVAVDVRQDVLKAARKDSGFPSIAVDYREIADMVDAVVVSTPNHTHYEVARFFLDRGKHVLCEKPLAVTYADAAELFQRARAKGATLMVGFNRRFSDNIRLLREITASFTPRAVVASLGGDMSKWPAVSGYRTLISEAGGGCVIDQGIHLIDMAIWFFGAKPNVAEVRMDKVSGWEVEDNAFVRLLFEGGEAALSCSYTFGLKNEIKVRFDNGWASTHLNDVSVPVTYSNKRSLLCKAAGCLELSGDGVDSYDNQARHFIECVVDGTDCQVREEDVLCGMEVLEEIYSRCRQ